MSSNKEASKTAADQGEPNGVIRDKRRFNADGEPIEEETPEEESSSKSDSAPYMTEEIDLLHARLKDAEDARGEAERKVAEMADRFRRTQEQLKSETEEQRARLNRTFDQKLDVARGDLVASLLDTLDNLKRAVAAAEKSEKRNADFNALLEGVRATASMFEAKMTSLGLTPVPSVGEEFNPEIHEAVDMTPVPAEQDHKVLAEYQTGYKFGDRLLRPARVRVGRAG